MRRTSFADFHCSLARSLEVMGDWWVPLIVRDLALGLDRFEDLATDLGISRNLLTARLDDLVANGLVEREQYSAHPPRDRYVLTEAGRELVPILAALTAWGDRWQTPPGGPPLRLRHDGHRCTAVVTCSVCGEMLTTDALTVERGPGAQVAPGTRVIAERVSAPRRR
jgi:DNA-binding HxlR family transcriptional regulator